MRLVATCLVVLLYKLPKGFCQTAAGISTGHRQLVGTLHPKVHGRKFNFSMRWSTVVVLTTLAVAVLVQAFGWSSASCSDVAGCVPLQVAKRAFVKLLLALVLAIDNWLGRYTQKCIGRDLTFPCAGRR